ncbi:MAG: AraC family ligand binding domain-containing protein [Burkholderiaceae bacterium]
MNNLDFHAFEADARAQGFDEVLERHWQPDSVLADHAHSFAVSARIVQGEMWLTMGEQTQHLLSGDTFTLERDVTHSEKYGPQGATYWVARRN